MQALSVWPSKGGSFLLVPYLDLEVGSTCTGYCSARSRRKEKRSDFVDNAFFGKRSYLFVVNNNLRYGMMNGACGGCSKFGLRRGFLSDLSGSKPFPFLEVKKGTLGSLVRSGLALEQQEVAGEFNGLGSSSDDSLSRDNETRVLENENLDRPEGNNTCGNREDNGEVAHRDDEEDGELKGPRIDVRALAQSLHSARTADDVEEVLKDKGELPLRVHSSMIRGFGWDKKMECASALVEWLRRKKKENRSNVGPNLFIYNNLLSVVKQSERFEETEKILNDMTQEGVVPNVVTYNTLMIIYVEQGKPEKALDILEMMRTKGFTPSAASYSTALLAYRTMEDGNEALKFFLVVKEKYVKGEIRKDNDDDWEKEFPKLENFTVRVCYQVMRRWLVKSEDLSTNVLKLLVEVDKAGLQPGRSEYERLVWACTREEHYAVARELYKRIRESYNEISLSVCNHVIWLMGKAKKWWAALEIYEDLLDKGPQPNNLSYELIVSHFNVLLTAARRRGIWRWGVRLLNKMEDKGLKPGSKEWNAVLVACSKASETTAAVQIFRRMVEQGEKPTVVSYGALLSALEKSKLYDEAVRVWEHMLKVGVQPNLYAYTTMASVFTGQGNFRLVDAIIQKMTSSGVEPTVVTYNAIISGCARNSSSRAAYEWFHRMRVHNITPNEITYEMLIEALAKDGKPRLAYELYLRARNEGLNLSSKVYDAVLHSSHVHGATIDTSVLGPRPPEIKKKVQIRKTLTEFCRFADVPRRSRPFDRNEIYASQVDGEQ